jgi:hypothetical protein
MHISMTIIPRSVHQGDMDKLEIMDFVPASHVPYQNGMLEYRRNSPFSMRNAANELT